MAYHALTLLPLLALLACSRGAAAIEVNCDVVIAGGTTAAFAAAITAAEADPGLQICLTEPTDWLGGQLTAGGVPAIDFGAQNRLPGNLPASLRDLFDYIKGNPGACWVSIKCFLPDQIVEKWIKPRVARLKNLAIYYYTSIVGASKDPATGKIEALLGIRRTAVNGYVPFTDRLSEELPDWYSPADSHRFHKDLLTFKATVFIEATELGDVLVSGGLRFAQGVEVPTEDNFTTNSTCGQASTLTYYMTLLENPLPRPQEVPPGSDAGLPFKPWTDDDWAHDWTYRRAQCAGNTSFYAVNVNDITQQNMINDLDNYYLYLPAEQVQRERPWQGGINLTVLKLLEDRAYGSFHYILDTAPKALKNTTDRLILNYPTANTTHGLSKFIYLRDTRRAIGLDGFRLNYTALNYYNASSPALGYRFDDTVALGNYPDDIHRLVPDCLPDYINSDATKPYYIPLRALLVGDVTNLLVAGKTMAQTFHANAAVRLHPSEWSSGVAAGGTAVLMVRNDWSVRDALAQVQQVQAFLNSSKVGQPLEWQIAPSPPVQLGWSCAGFNMCVGTADAVKPLYPSNTCNSTCPPLADNQWVANMQYWRVNGSVITAIQSTALKKSTADSTVLPPEDVRAVSEGTNCTLVNDAVYENYRVCGL